MGFWRWTGGVCPPASRGSQASLIDPLNVGVFGKAIIEVKFQLSADVVALRSTSEPTSPQSLRPKRAGQALPLGLQFASPSSELPERFSIHFSGGSPMTTSKCRILCIDDHHDSAEMLRLLLAEEETEVVIATSMTEALELIRDQKFDLYVLDRRLPDGSGMELCTVLNSVTPDVPCIFYTGDAYEIHRIEALEA